MNAIEQLKSVLCDQEGKCCIRGSDADRAIVDRALEELTTPQQAEAVPPGYVLVPVEPTEAMLLSARDWSATKYGKPIGDDAAKGCWGAMVAAAIAQQKGGV